MATSDTPLTPETRQAELARIDRLARLLDAQFRFPGTNFRFGLDSMIGLIPGIGDTLTALPSAYMIWRGYKMGLPGYTLGRMAANTGIDYVIGSIPLVGDLFDLGFKANLRNAEILREGLTLPAPEAEKKKGSPKAPQFR